MVTLSRKALVFRTIFLPETYANRIISPVCCPGYMHESNMSVNSNTTFDNDKLFKSFFFSIFCRGMNKYYLQKQSAYDITTVVG